MDNDQKAPDKSPPIQKETKKYSMKTFLTLFVLFIAVVIGVYLKFIFDPFDITQAVPKEVNDFFNRFDENGDGYLTPKEFEFAFYTLKDFQHFGNVNITEVEVENFHVDVKKELEETTFDENENILNLVASFEQIKLDSMKKFSGDQYNDDRSLYHLHGLQSWKQANIQSANFSIQNFSVFLPTSKVNLSPGKTWQLIPIELAGHSFQSKHLGQKRYLPPIPEGDFQRIMLYILSMLHPRPFLHMRFPPRGAIACLRGISAEYYDIMFRLHPEFQLNEPPRFPFWFTPAAFVGEIVIKKDGTHIQYFNMYLPTRKQLNIDMEWITSHTKKDGSHGQEVDIGFVPEMRITSSQPSSVPSKFVDGIETLSGFEESTRYITWKDGVLHEDAYQILEKKFYPFKNICYHPFNETFDKAKSEKKLIHHILLWGSLDDQSC